MRKVMPVSKPPNVAVSVQRDVVRESRKLPREQLLAYVTVFDCRSLRT